MVAVFYVRNKFLQQAIKIVRFPLSQYRFQVKLNRMTVTVKSRAHEFVSFKTPGNALNQNISRRFERICGCPPVVTPVRYTAK